MLSLEQTRAHVGPNCELSDPQLLVLRDQLYGLAELFVDAAHEPRLRESLVRQTPAVAPAFRNLSPGQLEEIDERAAILEFDGHLEKSIAERCALHDLGIEGQE